MRPKHLSAATLAALALSTTARADFQAVAPPSFAGASNASFALWGGDPGQQVLTGFTVAVGGPNLPNDPASDLAATVTQLTAGAVVTTTGNIYNPVGASVFEVAATPSARPADVVLQFRTVGTVMDIGTVVLEATDGSVTVALPPTRADLVLDSTAGFAVQEWELGWDLRGLIIDATGIVIRTTASGPSLSFDDARLDVLVDAPMGAAYCAANPNSTGRAASIAAYGDDRVASNAALLRATDLPTHTFGYFLVSADAGFIAAPGGSQGNLCLSGAIGRYSSSAASSGAAGELSLSLDLTAVPTPTGAAAALPGDVLRFQAWYRDANPAVTSNLTNATAVTFR